ncbi:hypothetical protein FEM41_02040 [Jejubacter calystegiae]|uniref:Nitrile hydratase beta subunit n=1 Tax=Jejubacter calystegiae TaxID=2579935 RepID=A0A4P8YD74_9ENTR|nr:hypothetical protein [Jejubacter calystegiae]QCT18505.1 hypothetical protein FEM41_02040 [Jejubacter calystegiae]
MKPTSLKPGQRVVIAPEFGTEVERGTFIRRVPRYYGKPAYCIVRVDGYAGLHGEDDLGDTHYSDYAVSRRFQLEGKNNG